MNARARGGRSGVRVAARAGRQVRVTQSGCGVRGLCVWVCGGGGADDVGRSRVYAGAGFSWRQYSSGTLSRLQHCHSARFGSGVHLDLQPLVTATTYVLVPKLGVAIGGKPRG